MSRKANTSRVAAVSAAVTLLVVTAGLAPTAVADPASPTSPGVVPVTAEATPIRADAKISDDIRRSSDERLPVFVRLSRPGTADVFLRAQTTGGDRMSAKAAGKAHRARLADLSAAVAQAAKEVDPRASRLFATRNSIPGVALLTTRRTVNQLAKRPDVEKISLLRALQPTNAGAAELTKAVRTWRSLGNTGRGIRIGIIDTGIDYTHADFGGAGTRAAYTAAKANNTSWTPTEKVVGGYDFAGDDYNADSSSTRYQPVPKPDPNPLDCEGHGTHVAGSAAGYGVTAAGGPFSGDYTRLTTRDLADMRIGPGMAPHASLYALRVFGCEGGTLLTIPALDWALDPNEDGDFSDHLDIVNMSLGANFAPSDDPLNAVVDELTAHGVLSVVAAGNAGDLTDAAGSPARAVTALTVASSKDALSLRDAIRVNAPAALRGPAAGQASVDFPWSTAPDVTGTVAVLEQVGNLDGCDPLSAADAARVKGKVAWLEWDDNAATRRCGSAGRSTNVANAGAIGALFTSTLDEFDAGIAGSRTIPVFQLTRSSTGRLAAAARAGTLNVTFSGTLLETAKIRVPGLVDTLSSFSSRGTHGHPGVVKPDVAAVGETVISAEVGSGDKADSKNGTSMAAPVTSGIAALVLARHPSWSPERVKTAIMNTATHDIYTGEGRTGLRFGPARVGSGRVDAAYATTTSVLAYSDSRPGAVSVSFGVVEASATRSTVRKTQWVRLVNTSSQATRLRVRYSPVVRQPGVSYAVTPSVVPLRRHSSKRVKVTMTVRTDRLRRTIDPTMATTQVNPLTLPPGRTEARQYVSGASGHLLVDPPRRRALRVPVYGAAKPVSQTRAVVETTGAQQKAIRLVGEGFDQGRGTAEFQSKVSVLNLGHRSGKLPRCVLPVATTCVFNATTRAADLHYVGAGAAPGSSGSRAEGALWFGVSTFGNWATLRGATTPLVDIDVDGDGEFDYVVAAVPAAGTDLLLSVLFDGAGNPVSYYPVNFLEGDVDTNVFDTNTVLLPVSPADIGLTDGKSSFPIRYQVSTFSPYAADDGAFDTTPWIDFDVAAPAIQVASPLYLDADDTTIPYTVSPPTQAASSGRGSAALTSVRVDAVQALLLHLHGESGERAEVVTLPE